MNNVEKFGRFYIPLLSKDNSLLDYWHCDEYGVAEIDNTYIYS